MAKIKKRYEDMTPQEQFEFRTSDSSGTRINGRLVNAAERKEEEDAAEADPAPASPRE